MMAMRGTAPKATPGDPDPAETVQVWDLPLRVWHWLLAVLVLVAWVTPNVHDRLHRLAGYAVLGLLAFRLIWGLVGTRHQADLGRAISLHRGIRDHALIRANWPGGHPKRLRKAVLNALADS